MLIGKHEMSLRYLENDFLYFLQESHAFPLRDVQLEWTYCDLTFFLPLWLIHFSS